MPDCFLVHWLCGGAWAWTPGEWPVGLLTAVYHQAWVQQTCGLLTWEVALESGRWVVIGGRN